MKKNQPQLEQKSQTEQFKETARFLECDEDEVAFEKKLKRLSSHKPKKEASKS